MNKCFYSSKMFAVAFLFSGLAIAMESPDIAITPKEVPTSLATDLAQSTIAPTQQIPVVPVPSVSTSDKIAAAARKVQSSLGEKSATFRDAVQTKWHAFINATSSKKVQVINTFSKLKSDGWKGLTKNEKIGVVVGGTIVAATVAYIIFKIYKSCAKKDKKQKSVVTINLNK